MPNHSTVGQISPHSTELARSAQLVSLIKQSIQTQGRAISFAEYMQLALYTPELGYYNSPTISFGKSGDFITAPEISPLFSRVIAKQILPSLVQIDQPNILEFGAGSGKMAAGILSELEQRHALPKQYLILETSQHLQKLQRQTLAKKVPEHLARVKWLSQLPVDFKGIILANEVMDAMPIKRFIIEKNQTFELLVSYDLAWTKGNKIKLNLPDPIEEYAEGYTSEFSNIIQPWIQSLTDTLQQGLILLIDYGYESFEYYHPARHTGTLKCFYRHQQHEDPFLYPGLCDISAHVDFSAIATIKEPCAFLYQSEFLIYGGISEIAGTPDDVILRAKTSKAIQTLTAPDQMGETIKVMGLCKNITAPDFI